MLLVACGLWGLLACCLVVWFSSVWLVIVYCLCWFGLVVELVILFDCCLICWVGFSLDLGYCACLVSGFVSLVVWWLVVVT